MHGARRVKIKNADCLFDLCHHSANIYLFKVNNRSTQKRCEICSELTIKTPERYQ